MEKLYKIANNHDYEIIYKYSLALQLTADYSAMTVVYCCCREGHLWYTKTLLFDSVYLKKNRTNPTMNDQLKFCKMFKILV